MYIVMELQTNSEGQLGNFVWSYNTLAEAESKYHSVLSFAAVSTVPIHAAVILNEQGNFISSKAYYHPVEEPIIEDVVEEVEEELDEGQIDGGN